MGEIDGASSFETRPPSGKGRGGARRHWHLVFDLAQGGFLDAANRLLDLPVREKLAQLDLQALQRWKGQRKRIGERTAGQILAALEALQIAVRPGPPEEKAEERLDACREALESAPLEDPGLLALTAWIHATIEPPDDLSAELARNCIALLREEPEPRDPMVRARHLVLFGRCLEFLDEVKAEDEEEAFRRSRLAFKLYSEAHDTIGQAEALQVQALARMRRNPIEAAALHERAARLHARGGNPRSAAGALCDAAMAARKRTPYGAVTEVTERAFRKAAEMFQRCGDEELARTALEMADPPPRPRSRAGMVFSLLLLGVLVYALLKGADLILWLVLLGAAVLIHELGHWAAAAAAGIPIQLCRIGLGSRLFFFKLGRTRVEVDALPLLGTIMPAYTTRRWFEWKERRRRSPEGSFEEEPAGGLGDEPRFYLDLLSPLRRMVYGIGGLAGNLAAAFILLWAASTFDVASRTKTAPVLGDVPPGSVAEQAGLQRGDRILSIDGEPVAHHGDPRVASLLDATPKPRAIALDVERGSGTIEIAWPALAIRPHTRWIQSCVGVQPMKTWTISHVHPSARDRLRGGDEILSASWGGNTISSDAHRSPMALRWLFRRAGRDPVEVRIRRADHSIARLAINAVADSSRDSLAGLELDPRIARVREGSAAWAAGLRPGDKVTSVDAEPVRGYFEMARLLEAAALRTVPIDVEREGASLRIELPPEPMRIDMPGRGILEGVFDSSLEDLPIVSVPSAWEDLRPHPEPGERIESRFFHPPHEFHWRNTAGETFGIDLDEALGARAIEETPSLPPFDLQSPTVTLPALGPREVAGRILAFGARFYLGLPRFLADAVKDRIGDERRDWIVQEGPKSPWRIARILAAFSSLVLYFNLIPFPPLDGFRIASGLAEVALRRDPARRAVPWIRGIGCAALFLLILLNGFLLARALFLALFG